MALALLPSHTIIIGARADFGRLFSSTRYGSNTADIVLLLQSKMAVPTPSSTISAKLIPVSATVTAVW